MEILYLKLGDKMDETEGVMLIASGYEWLCPECNTFNKFGCEIPKNLVKVMVTCTNCKRKYDIDGFEHAFE